MAHLMDIRVERNVAVPMRDGTVLRADVFRPEPEGRYPVLLMRTPYSKAVGSTAYNWLPPIRPASEGYVVVIQDVRGRFESEGDFRPFHQEIDDGFDTVEWAARQVWSNGRVGMYGASYYGATQWLAAKAQAPNLQAIFPGLTASDYYDGWIYQGGAFELAFNTMWAGTGFAIPETLKRDMDEATRQKLLRGLYALAFDHWPVLRHLPVRDIPAFAHDLVAPYYKEWLDHPTRDDYWESVSIEAAHSRIHTPAFNLGGWFDMFLRGTLRNYTGMRENAPTDIARNGQKLIVGPWIHGAMLHTQAGHSNFGAVAQIVLEELHMRWFDHWLRDRDTGIDREPPVRVFTVGANRWHDFDAWPPKEAAFTPYFLHSNGGANTARGDGALTAHAPTGGEQPDRIVYDPLNPVPTRGGGNFVSPSDVPAGQFDQAAVEQRQDVLCYTSAALAEDLEIAGPVEARLWVASSQPDTDFTVKLVDVAPDGVALNLCDGILRTRYRDGFERPSLLRGGEPVAVTVDMTGIAALFRAGHRIRIEVSSSNFPRFDRNTNTGGIIATDAGTAVAVNSVLHDEAHPSALILPVIRR